MTYVALRSAAASDATRIKQGQLDYRRTGQVGHFSVILTVGVFWYNLFPQFGGLPCNGEIKRV
jgi:hypothetical protein